MLIETSFQQPDGDVKWAISCLSLKFLERSQLEIYTGDLGSYKWHLNPERRRSTGIEGRKSKDCALGDLQCKGSGAEEEDRNEADQEQPVGRRIESVLSWSPGDGLQGYGSGVQCVKCYC